MNAKNMQTADMRVTYPNLDIAKFFCALLVVTVHTAPLANSTVLGNFYLNHVIARIAVPLFFAMSGFLFFGSVVFENGRIACCAANHKQLLRAVWKNLCLYTIWSFLYLTIRLPEWYQTGWWGIAAVKDWLHTFFLISSYYHLWYLLALIAALPMLYLLLLIVPVSKVWFIAAVLWVLECLTYSYYWIGVDRIPIVAFISEKMPVVFAAALRAVPLMSIGAVRSRRSGKPANAGICIGAFLLCALEASILFFFTPNEDKYSYLFTTPLITAAFLSVLIYGKQLSVPENWQYRLRDMSLLIYCVHPMFCYLLGKMGIAQGLLLWVSVTVLSVGVAFLWSDLKIHLRKQKSQ